MYQNLAWTDNFGFWTKIYEEGYFQWKVEKVNITIEFWILELV